MIVFSAGVARRSGMGCATALLVALTACGVVDRGDEAGPQLVSTGNPNDVAMGSGRVEPGGEISFGGMILCLDRPGQVTITAAKPVNPSGGIQIDQFGVRPSPYWRGDHTAIGVLGGGLRHNHFPPGRTVDVTCGKHGRGYELAVTASMPDSTEARMEGVEVDYVSAGEERSVIFPITLFLCPHKIRGNRTCNAIP